MRVFPTLSVLTVVVDGAKTAKKQDPIRKIVHLLEDMVVQMKKEKEEDDAVYEKLQCWCKKNREEQTAIQAKAAADFKASVEVAKNAFGTMQAVENKKNKMFTEKSAKSKEESDFREKCMAEAKEFNAKNIELKETLTAAKTAVTILEGGQSLLQSKDGLGKANELKGLMVKLLNSNAVNELAETKPEALVALQGYVDEESTMRQSPSFLQADSQNVSGGALGMLTQMVEDLNNQIEAGAKGEKERKAVCEEKLTAMEKEVEALGESIAAKEKRVAELSADDADAKAAADEAKTARLNAEEFLGKLNKQCREAEEQYNSRTQSRNEEIKGCGDTIEILEGEAPVQEEGQAPVDGQVPVEGQAPAAFLQVSAEEQRANGIKSALFSMEGVAKGNARVMLVQAMIRSAAGNKEAPAENEGGVFAGIVKAIDELVGELKAEQKQEVADRDDCISTEATLKKDVDDVKFHLAAAQETSEEMAQKIQMFTKDLEENAAAIVEIDNQVAEATKIREESAAEFAVVQQDQTATQMILQKAIERMSQVYKSLLLQQPVEFGATVDTPGSAPAAFKNGGKTTQNAGGSKVVNLLNKVLDDSKAELAKATQAENDAIAQYEEFMRVSNRDKTTAEESIAEKSERKVTSEVTKEDAERDTDSLTKQLTGLVEGTLKHQQSCAFLMNNFAERQKKRTEEIQSLNNGKRFLEGMK